MASPCPCMKWIFPPNGRQGPKSSTGALTHTDLVIHLGQARGPGDLWVGRGVGEQPHVALTSSDELCLYASVADFLRTAQAANCLTGECAILLVNGRVLFHLSFCTLKEFITLKIDN